MPSPVYLLSHLILIILLLGRCFSLYFIYMQKLEVQRQEGVCQRLSVGLGQGFKPMFVWFKILLYLFWQKKSTTKLVLTRGIKKAWYLPWAWVAKGNFWTITYILDNLISSTRWLNHFPLGHSALCPSEVPSIHTVPIYFYSVLQLSIVFTTSKILTLGMADISLFPNLTAPFFRL